LVELKLNDSILLSFKDVMNHREDLTTFTRIVKNQEYIFNEGELLVKKIIKNVPFLTKIKRNMFNSKTIITMDLETRVINEVMSSYCVVIYDGKLSKRFYMSEFNNEKEMLKASILFLMKRKYHNHKVFLQNFSNFDAVFLLTVMTDVSDQVQPVLRDGQYINLTLKFAGKYKLYFRDSYLILPSSLRNLAKNFGVENKGIFPYRFVNNKNISLNYSGPLPAFEYFDGITEEEYNNYSKEFIDKA
jgi:hypothetical protein